MLRTYLALTVAALALCFAGCDSSNGGDADAAGDGQDVVAAPDGGADTYTPEDVLVTPEDVHAGLDTPSDPDEDAFDTDPDVVDVPDEDVQLGEDTTAPLETCVVRGSVQDGDAAAVDGMRVILCDENVCITGQTGSDGTFEIPFEEETPLALKALGKAAGLTSASLPIAACDGVPVLTEVGTIQLEALPQDGPLVSNDEPNDAQVHPDLLLSIPAGIKLPGFAREAEIGAVLLPAQAQHPMTIGDLEPLAVFSFEPYGVLSETPIGVEARVPGASGPLNVWELDHETGILHLAFTATADADGVVRSADGEGIHDLSWLVIAP